MVKFILARHGTRVRELDPVAEKYIEMHLGLNEDPSQPSGVDESCKLGAWVRLLGVKPIACLSSSFEHAKQTAGIMRDETGEEANVFELCTLTPHFQGPPGWVPSRYLEGIVREALHLGIDLRKAEAVVLVFHQPRIKQLCEAMTGEPQEKFDLRYGEGVCLKGETLDAFFSGKAIECDRFVRT